MDELIAASVEYPTVALSIIVGISMAYWLFVILGALDLDILGSADGDGGGGDAGDAGEIGDGSGTPTFLTGLGLRTVPLTVSLTTIAIVAWVISLLGNYYIAAYFGGGIAIAIKTGVFALALVAGLLLAAVLVRPLAPIFKTHGARTRDYYIGSTCTVDTGKVDAGFGQAKIEDGGDVLVISIRCDSENTLGRGESALVIDYDSTREAYVVEPSFVEPTLGLSSDKRN